MQKIILTALRLLCLQHTAEHTAHTQLAPETVLEYIESKKRKH